MWRVSFPVKALQNRRLQTLARIQSRIRDVMQVVGTTLLSRVQLAYREKARKQTGSDGIKWAGLQRSSIEGRVRSRAPAKRIVEQRRALAAEIKSLLKANKVQGKSKKSGKRKVTNPNQTRINQLRKKRKSLSEKLQALVDKEFAKYEIGVDTGLQRASAAPGFEGGDGRGGNVLKVENNAVTIGFNRQYSKYFDEKRKLLPEKLPDEWQRAVESKITTWANAIAKEGLE